MCWDIRAKLREAEADSAAKSLEIYPCEAFHSVLLLGRSCGRFELFKTGVWCHCFSDSLDHSAGMFKFRRGISRLILLLIASCKSNLIRLPYKIMCYILSKHQPAPRGGDVGWRWMRHVSLSAATTSFECRNFCSSLINSSKENEFVLWRTPDGRLSFAFKNKLCFSAAPTNFGEELKCHRAPLLMNPDCVRWPGWEDGA